MRGNPGAITDVLEKKSNRHLLVQTDRVRSGYCFTLHITHKKLIRYFYLQRKQQTNS